ncbi:CRAL-TRIO domain-containing protein [Lipomyces tetrasporus]|uniref:SEC14 homolog 3 n=1 Tax=Lipomyces tetrasporus TaxID=54092 RepID=A0AAD7QQB6_9ASCO|nr:CRAL-TRIO domain-containing protein [Lipomyces tetrasporus]KAJ8099285.1 CRAL-TRIO domain-containing protein [Lipomyces tetrasporus]
MVRYVPFTEPLPSCKPSKRPPLTSEEQEKYDMLLEHMNNIKDLPISSNQNEKTMRPLDDEEQAWVTKECLLRYLRATKWKLADAQKRVEGSLIWRREYGVRELSPDYISPENATGKQVILGYDFASRPCLYLHPSRQNTDKSNRQIQHLVFSLERVIDFMPSGQETLALLIDFKSSTSSKNPSVNQGRQVLHILQTHYPERLGKALVINIPWFVWTFLKIIYPFIDPLTREKLVFSEPIDKYVPADHLDTIFGGKSEFEYHHDKYWNAMCEMAADKRKRYMERWRKLGGGIGLSEAALRAETEEEMLAELARTETLEKEAEATYGANDAPAAPAESSKLPDELLSNTKTAEEAAAAIDAAELAEKTTGVSVEEQLSQVSLQDKSS